MKIYVIGSGYVGLTTAAVLATAHEVHCFDALPERVSELRNGRCPIHEYGLTERLAAISGFHAAEELDEVVRTTADDADEVLYVVATQTPQSPDGSTDTSYVDAAIYSCLELGRGDVVVKSTVPPALLSRWAEVTTWPEFLREGTAIQDSLTPDRTVVGGPAAQKVLDAIKPVVDPAELHVFDDARTPMMIKYASNAFLATKISFINEVARLCDALEIDVEDVADGMGADRRIGPEFLGAGLGWGGSCFPKDTRSLLAQGRQRLVELSVVDAAIATNDTQPEYVLSRIERMRRALDLPRIATVYGVAFKPGTDDVRESLQVELVERLVLAGWRVAVDDPQALKKFERLPVSELVTYSLASPIAIVGTEWPKFSDVHFAKTLGERNARAVFDCRNCLTDDAREQLAEFGITYEGVGR